MSSPGSLRVTLMKSWWIWRMIAPVLAISCLLLAVGVVSGWYVHRVNAEVSQALDRRLEAAIACEKLVLAVRDLRAELDRYLATGETAYLDAALASQDPLRRQTSELERAVLDSQDRGLVQQVQRHQQRLFGELQQLRQTPDPAAASELRRGLSETVLAPAQQLLEDTRQAVKRDSRSNQIMADRVGVVLFVLGVCGAAGGVIAGYGIARGVSRSVMDLERPLREMADTLHPVSGPTDFRPDAGLPELHYAARSLADKTNTVVKQLHETRQHAERSEQLAAVGQLAAGLAHELRNPLTSIKLLVQAAEDRHGRLAGRDLEVLEEEIVRLEKLLQTFLDFARPPRAEKMLLDAGKLAADAVELMLPRVEQQGIRVALCVEDDDLLLEGDGQQLRQVLLNLILNAADALPGGGQIMVRICRERRSDGDEIVLSVADNGLGLPEDLGQRIFEPFVSTKETGIGLGLSICRRIVESHGGEIEAENRSEGGAVFTVRLAAAGDDARRALHDLSLTSIPAQQYSCLLSASRSRQEN